MAKKGNKSNKATGRPKPVSGKGSYTKSSRRYGCGGKVKK